MPFINVKVTGLRLAPEQTVAIQTGITSLMTDVLRKQRPLITVLVEEVPSSGWAIGGEAVTRAVHVDATISEDTNTPEEKARFIAETNDLLREILGHNLHVVSYIVVHDIPKNSWGYCGLTQGHRARCV